MLDIPLLIRFPGGRRTRRVAEVVEQVDLLPTVLALYGLAPPAPVQGRSLLPLCRPRPPVDWKDRSVSHVERVGRVVGVSWLEPSWKLILRQGEGTVVASLFDRRVDRREQRDLAAERPQDLARLRSALARTLATTPGGLERPRGSSPADDEVRKQLRSLGYLQ